MAVKVLYVDDEQINLLLFEQMFMRKYQVLTAMSGYSGFEILEQNPDIKVIISDMKMPGMNGIEFIKKAKQQYPTIVFYILTGYEITPEIQDALEEGIILKYFQKPYNMVDIDNSIIEKLGLG